MHFTYSWINRYHYHGSAPSYCFLTSNDKCYNKRKLRIFLHIKPVTFLENSSPSGLPYLEYTGIDYQMSSSIINLEKLTFCSQWVKIKKTLTQIIIAENAFSIPPLSLNTHAYYSTSMLTVVGPCGATIGAPLLLVYSNYSYWKSVALDSECLSYLSSSLPLNWKKWWIDG